MKIQVALTYQRNVNFGVYVIDSFMKSLFKDS